MAAGASPRLTATAVCADSITAANIASCTTRAGATRAYMAVLVLTKNLSTVTANAHTVSMAAVVNIAARRATYIDVHKDIDSQGFNALNQTTHRSTVLLKTDSALRCASLLQSLANG